MAGKKQEERPQRRPATTPEQNEQHLVLLATELARKQMEEGTASAQVITHYLKLGSTRETLEQQRLASENELLKARVESLQQAGHMQELYDKAIKAMRSYQGDDEVDEEYYDEN